MEVRHTLHTQMPLHLPSILKVIYTLPIFSPDSTPSLTIGWKSYEALTLSSHGIYKMAPVQEKRGLGRRWLLPDLANSMLVSETMGVTLSCNSPCCSLWVTFVIFHASICTTNLDTEKWGGTKLGKWLQRLGGSSYRAAVMGKRKTSACLRMSNRVIPECPRVNLSNITPKIRLVLILSSFVPPTESVF